MKTDIEIAQSIELKPIVDVVEKLGISYDDLELYGKYKAKLSFDKIREVESNPVGKLILVTAINPTPAGEGKSTITIGLADAMNTKMYDHPATQANLKTLEDYGYTIISPKDSLLACGDTGRGALADFETILQKIKDKIHEQTL